MKYRSKFEQHIAQWLTKHKIHFTYESGRLVYYQNIPSGFCRKCGLTDVGRRRVYIPDFVLSLSSGGQRFLEGKGKLDVSQRTKFLALTKVYDIRLIFMRNNKIYRTSETRYMDWAKQHGIRACVFPDIPRSWFVGSK